jgi:hypothetical protein
LKNAAVTALRVVSGGAADRTVEGLEVAYLTEDGEQHRTTLPDAWATRFEWCLPARRFPSYKGQRHFNGRWWSSTMSQHVGYESWLERDLNLMLLDHDPAVVAVASQPFWLFWLVGEGKVRSHVPDYFARLATDRTTSAGVAPAALSSARQFLITWSVCAA